MSAEEVPDVVVRWFRDHIDEIEGALEFTRITGGRSNLTYRVTDEAGHAWALRRPPLGGVLETAHDMSREWRFLSALNPTDVPVPTPRAFCDDHDVWGADLYVMDFAPGKVLNDTESGEKVPQEARAVVGTSTIDVLAALHAVEPGEVGLDDLARPGNFVARQLKRWHRQAHSSAMEDLSALDAAHDALAARVPEGAVGIVHGDYRPGNIAYSPEGQAVAVFDWELATIGDPLCDLGHLLVSWSEPGDTVPEALAEPDPGRRLPHPRRAHRALHRGDGHRGRRHRLLPGLRALAGRVHPRRRLDPLPRGRHGRRRRPGRGHGPRGDHRAGRDRAGGAGRLTPCERSSRL